MYYIADVDRLRALHDIMDTKEKILRLSFVLFLNQGYNNTSMNDLVTASTLSKGAFYHYFKSKEHLYNTIIDTYFLSYFRKVNWNDLNGMHIDDIETGMKLFYSRFIKEVNAFSEKGLSSYFIMFFEAFQWHPTFKEEVQGFYRNLRLLLEVAPSKEGSSSDALLLIAKYEGLLFWSALFSDEKIQELTVEAR